MSRADQSSTRRDKTEEQWSKIKNANLGTSEEVLGIRKKEGRELISEETRRGGKH